MSSFFYRRTVLPICILLSTHSLAFSFTCDDALWVECGKIYWFEAPQNDHLNRISYDFSDCGHLPWYYDGNDKLFVVDVGPDPVTLKISLAGLSDNLDLFVFKGCSDHHNAITLEECVGMSINEWNLGESIEVPGASGVYYIAVDAAASHHSSGFQISIQCTEEPPLCAQIETVECGQKIYGDNRDYNEYTTDKLDLHSGCEYWDRLYEGPERIYKIPASPYSRYDITVDLYSHGFHVDHDLFIYTRCVSYKDSEGKWRHSLTPYDQYCHKQYHPYSNHETAFIEYIPPHIEIYIVVEGRPDGYGGYSRGSFEINISCGDPCRQKVYEIVCNSDVLGSTLGLKNRSSYYSCGYYDYRGHNWGPEMTYFFDLEENTEVDIELKPEEYADLNLFLLSSCSAQSCIDQGIVAGEGGTERIKTILGPGRYYIVIEGYRGSYGKFELSLNGCNCFNNDMLVCNEKVEGNTSNGSFIVNELKETCFTLSSEAVSVEGPENIYVFEAPESNTYTFNLTDLNKNLDLYLIDNCQDVNACRGFSTKAGTTEEKIDYDMLAGERILVLVDSWSNLLTSSYVLQVTCGPKTVDEEGNDEHDEPTEDPENECLIEVSTTLNSISLDLSAVYSANDPEIDQFLVLYPLLEGKVDSSKADTLAVLDSLIEYEAGLSDMERTFAISFEKIQDGDRQACCLQATLPAVLGCGMQFVGSTKNSTSHYGKEDIESCYSSASLFDGPDVLVPFVKTSLEETIVLTLFQKEENLSLFILDEAKMMVRHPCKGNNFNRDKKMGNKGAVGEYFTDAADPLPTGFYYALIEGFAKNIADDFVLSMTCRPDCASINALACGELVSHGTVSGVNSMSRYVENDQQWVGYTGPEKVYFVHLESTTDIEFRLERIQGVGDGTVDLDLFVVEGPCPGGEVIGSGTMPGSNDEILAMTLGTGVYTVVVDGWMGSEGSFDLSVLGCDEGAFHFESIASARKGLQADESELRLYPNPFTDQLSIDLYVDGLKRIDIYTPDGRILYSSTKTWSKHRIQAMELGDHYGVLFYTVETKESTYHGKLLRVRR